VEELSGCVTKQDTKMNRDHCVCRGEAHILWRPLEAVEIMTRSARSHPRNSLRKDA